MAYFEIFEARANIYRVFVKTLDRIEFITEAYNSRIESIRNIKEIRHNAQRYDAYKIMELNCGSWLFELYDLSSNTLLGKSKTEVSKERIEFKIKEMRMIIPLAKFNSLSNSLHSA